MKAISTEIVGNGKYQLCKFEDGHWILFTNDDVGRIVQTYHSREEAEELMDLDIQEYEEPMR